MKIEGRTRIPAARAIVWERLLDPQALARSIPGCEKIEPNADGSYLAELKVGIAAVKGSYHSRIEILDQVPPEHYRMKVEGHGTGGFMKGEGTLTLSEEATETMINYSGEVQVGGVIASVGQRLILAAAKQIVNQFFQAFSNQVLASAPSAPTANPQN